MLLMYNGACVLVPFNHSRCYNYNFGKKKKRPRELGGGGGGRLVGRDEGHQ